MNNWFTNLISKMYTKFTVWLMEGNKCNVLFTENNKYIVLMNEHDYNEWKEFTENCYVIYENEEKLKEDFPDAKQKV